MTNKQSHLIFIKLFNMLVFATMFIVIGKFIPEIYYTYFDTKIYYSIENPVPIDKQVYTPGENIVLSFKRTSLVDVSATAYIELVLTSEDETYEIDTIQRPLALDSNPPTQTIRAIFPIKEDVPCGNYLIRGTVYFKINGVDKYAKFYTNKFEIIK